MQIIDPLNLVLMNTLVHLLHLCESNVYSYIHVCMHYRLVHSLCQATTLHHQPYVARAVLLSSNDKLMKDERNKCLLCTAKVCYVVYACVCVCVRVCYVVCTCV